MSYERSNADERLLFVLRRAYWGGECVRNHLIETFGVSKVQASKDLNHAVERFPHHLIRETKRVIGNRSVAPPRDASAWNMVCAAARAWPVRWLGVESEKIMASLPDVSTGLPSPPVLEELLKNILLKAPMDIQYVTLRPGAQAAWRTVLPSGFEFFGDRWRLVALDAPATKKSAPVQKRFVLSRILDTRSPTASFPAHANAYVASRTIKTKPVLNPQLTPDQKLVVSRELGLSADGTLVLLENDLFDFRRRYMDNTLSPVAPGAKAVVWPLVVELQEISTL